MLMVVLLSVSVWLSVVAQREFTEVNYAVLDPAHRNTNTELFDWYRPIRVHVYEADITGQLIDPSHQALFREIVRESVAKIQQLFHVYPVTGTLRLAYEFSASCKEHFETESRRCRLRRPSSERCGVDGFQIPRDHMDEYRLHSSNTSSTVDIAAGHGVEDTDLILYINAQALSRCIQHVGVLAFAEICKRDQFGRPIASFLNVCPTQFSAVSAAKLRETVLHELLHALGFLGSSLILLLQHCRVTDRLECTALDSGDRSLRDFPNTVLKETPSLYGNHYGFIGTHASAVWKEHVNCYSENDDYANHGPAWRMDLQKKTSGSPNPGDHWTWTAMMGSLMSPFIKKPYMQVLDNITIAWFKDTGWYKVSDSLTQPYLWGKNSGCEFSQVSFCQEINAGTRSDRFLCGQSGEAGCHYLHLHKGTCAYTETAGRPCQYYEPDPQGECFIPKESVSGSLEEYCEDCRCFMSSVHLTETISSRPSCFKRKCVDGSLRILINDTWIHCPYGRNVAVDVIGSIQCPPSDVLCTDRDLSLPNMIESQTTTATPTTPAPTTPAFTTTVTLKAAKDSDKVVACTSRTIYANLWLIYFLVFLLIQSI